MNIYVGIVNVKTPIIIKKRQGPRGYESREGIIPAPSLAGAINRILDAHNNIIVSEGYPIKLQGGKCVPSLPTPPTAFKIKFIPNNTRVNVPKQILLPLHFDIQRARLEAIEFWAKDIGMRPTGLVKPLTSHAIIPLDKKYKSSNEYYIIEIESVEVPASQVYDSVAVNPARGSVEEQMLYTYHAIPAGTKFWFTLSIQNNLEIDKCINEPCEAKLGGAKSRGFGRVTIKLLKINSKLCNNQIEVNSNLFYVWTRLPLGPDEMGGVAIGGWSMIKNLPKMSIRYYLPGSIIKLDNYSNYNYCQMRFMGVKPPLGHIEPVFSDTNGSSTFPFLYSYNIIRNIIVDSLDLCRGE